MQQSDQQLIAETYEALVIKPHHTSSCDDAVTMARSQVETIINNAQHVMELLQSTTDIEPWVASKLTLAEDYINTVAEQLRSPFAGE